eukprot:9403323-Pyramimonas_sp.AAC.1
MVAASRSLFSCLAADHCAWNSGSVACGRRLDTRSNSPIQASVPSFSVSSFEMPGLHLNSPGSSCRF